MKRVVSGLLAILVTLLVLCSAATASSVYKVTISIHFDSNLFFSRYDVDMYINDLELERLPHGKDYLGSFYAEEGPNILYFYKHDNKSVNGAIKFNVEGDTTIVCFLHCYNNEVELKVVNLSVVDASSVTKTMPEENKSHETPVTTEEPIKEKIELTEVPTQVISPEPTEDPTSEPEAITSPEPEPVTFSDINLQEMSDEELEEAAAAIKAEQRARIKTKIVLDRTSIELNIGKTDKISGIIEDLPDGEKAPKLEWNTSDKSIVSINNGQIRAVAEGTAEIVCSATLTDGTYIYEKCSVRVNVPVSSVNVDKKQVSIGVDEEFIPSYTVKPDNASHKGLTFASSKPTVASVNSKGVITGKGEGTAVITITSTDGTEKKTSINVKVKDDRGSLGKDIVTLTGKKTGIVCEVLRDNFTDYKDIFRNTMTTTVAVTVTAAQLTKVNKSFDVDIHDYKNDIMYAGVSKYDNQVLYMAYKDPDGKYWMVSVTPANNTIVYSKSKYSEKEAMAFMKKNCSQYDGVTAEDFFNANEMVDLIE